VRWHLNFIPTTLLENAILINVAVFLVESRRQRTPIQWRSPLTIPAFLFIVAGAISVIDAPDRRAALGLFRAYLLEPVAFALVAATICTNARRAYLLVGGLCLGAIWLGVPNALVVLAAIKSHAYKVTDTPPTVIYLTQNAVALFLEPILGMVAAALLYTPGRRFKFGSLVALVVLLPIEVLTFSRGGYLAMAATAFVLALSHRRRLWLIPGILVTGLLLTRIPLIGERLALETSNVYGNTVFFRYDIWTATARLLKERPLTGAGLSGFATRIAPFWNATHPLASQRFIDPHNIVLNFWVETGILGLLAFGWLFFALGYLCLRTWRRADPTWRPLALGVFLALVAIGVHGLVDVPYFKNDLSLEFWALLAIGLASYRATLASNPHHPSRLRDA